MDASGDELSTRELVLLALTLLSPIATILLAFVVRRVLQLSVSWWRVLLALGLGGLSIWLIALFHQPAEGPLAGFLPPSSFDLVVEAPLLEEGAKALAVLLLFFVSERFSSGVREGFFFGFSVGLGFALVENTLYFFRAPSHDLWANLLWTRNLLATPTHAVATALFAAALAWPEKRLLMAGAGLVAALVWHALANAWVQFGPISVLNAGQIVQPVAAIVLIVWLRKPSRTK